MTMNKSENKENILYKEIDRTMYVVNVKQSDNAKESAEDILVRLIAKESKNGMQEE